MLGAILMALALIMFVPARYYGCRTADALM